jgi:hypothetical protein
VGDIEGLVSKLDEAIGLPIGVWVCVR